MYGSGCKVFEKLVCFVSQIIISPPPYDNLRNKKKQDSTLRFSDSQHQEHTILNIAQINHKGNPTEWSISIGPCDQTADFMKKTWGLVRI
jgi:hypothetical protein